MNCAEIKDRLLAYARQEQTEYIHQRLGTKPPVKLGEEVRQEIEAHLQRCDSCAEKVAFIQQLYHRDIDHSLKARVRRRFQKAIFGFDFDLDDFDSPLELMMKGILIRAILDGASEIKIEPFDREFKVELLSGGEYQEFARVPLSLYELLDLYKAKAGLPQSVEPTVQTGSFFVETVNKRYPFEVSAAPTEEGERLVVRLLPPVDLRVGV